VYNEGYSACLTCLPTFIPAIRTLRRARQRFSLTTCVSSTIFSKRAVKLREQVAGIDCRGFLRYRVQESIGWLDLGCRHLSYASCPLHLQVTGYTLFNKRTWPCWYTDNIVCCMDKIRKMKTFNIGRQGCITSKARTDSVKYSSFQLEYNIYTLCQKNKTPYSCW